MWVSVLLGIINIIKRGFGETKNSKGDKTRSQSVSDRLLLKLRDVIVRIGIHPFHPFFMAFTHFSLHISWLYYTYIITLVTVNRLEEGVIVTLEDKSGLRTEGTYKQSYITLI